MLELGFVREHLDVIEKMADDRGIALDLAPFRELDADRRKIITYSERMKAERNKYSEIIGPLQKSIKERDAKGEDTVEQITVRDNMLKRSKELSEAIKQDDESVAALDERMRNFLLTIPNIPH